MAKKVVGVNYSIHLVLFTFFTDDTPRVLRRVVFNMTQGESFSSHEPG